MFLDAEADADLGVRDLVSGVTLEGEPEICGGGWSVGGGNHAAILHYAACDPQPVGCPELAVRQDDGGTDQPQRPTHAQEDAVPGPRDNVGHLTRSAMDDTMHGGTMPA